MAVSIVSKFILNFHNWLHSFVVGFLNFLQSENNTEHTSNSFMFSLHTQT